MFCKNCELSFHRKENNIQKRHCKKCMSSFYMKQAEKYVQEQLKQQELSPTEKKPVIYDEIKKAVAREVQVFTKRKTYLADELLHSSVMREISDNPNVVKVNRVIENGLEISNLSKIYCTVENKKKNTSYIATLNNCTCPDFAIYKRPCKHMYRLAMAIGLIDPPNKVKKK